MARAYRMTSARRAAIRKAQLASARKRRGKRRKKIAGGVVAAAGVIGVTMYATRGYRKRGKGSGPVNVVSNTMAQSHTSSGQIDVVRISPWDAGSNGLDYGEVGKPMRDLNLTKLRSDQRRIDKKLNAHKKGRGKVIAGQQGVVKRVKRNRTKFNDDRRRDYNSEARHNAYMANQEAIKLKNKMHARAKRSRTLLQQAVLPGINVDASRYPKTVLLF